MKFDVRYLLFAFTVVCFANITAQHFPSKQYMTSNGMPTKSVFDIAQHASGIMWFMTKAGPLFYDTKEWHSFPDSLNLPCLANAKIYIPNDTVWVAGLSKNSFTVNYYSNEKWESVPLPPDETLLNGKISFCVASTL